MKKSTTPISSIKYDNNGKWCVYEKSFVDSINENINKKIYKTIISAYGNKYEVDIINKTQGNLNSGYIRALEILFQI